MSGIDARATHFDNPVRHRIERGDVEFRCGVIPTGRRSGIRRQHSVAADVLLGDVVANEKMITEFVEGVGVEFEHPGRSGEGEAWLGGEHSVSKALRSDTMLAVGGDDQGISRLGDLTAEIVTRGAKD